MFGLGPTELVIIAVIILLIFGAKRIPEIGKGVGGAIREFKKVKKDLSTKETPDEGQNNDKANNKDSNPPTLEAKITDKLMSQVPGVKKAINIKKKAEKVKDFIK